MTFLDGLAVQGLFYRIERQNGSLDIRILRHPVAR